MGQIPCLIIINEGNLAYAAVEVFERNSSDNIQTNYLQAAIKAGCDSIHHLSLYFEIDDKEILTEEFTKPIIKLHKDAIEMVISDDIPSQQDINQLAIKLFRATRKLYTLFGITVESLDLIKLSDLIT